MVWYTKISTIEANPNPSAIVFNCSSLIIVGFVFANQKRFSFAKCFLALLVMAG